MPTVSPSQSNAGDLITAAAINNPINQIAAVINGNIDSTNLADGGITAVKIASNLPTSKLQNPYKFSISLTAAQSSINGSILINFDTKLFDTSSNFSTTTHLFTAPIAGFYQFNFSIACASGSAPSVWQAFLQKNSTGSLLYGNNNGSVGFVQSVGSGLIQLAANDTIGMLLTSNASSPVQTQSVVTYLHGFLVSAT